MTENNRTFYIRSKIWVEDQNGNVVFGLGRYLILDAVKRLGSLQAAAKELKMSYRAIWGRITATEKRIGKPLLIKDSQGSRLTPLAETLIKKFRRMRAVAESEADEAFDDLMVKHLS